MKRLIYLTVAHCEHNASILHTSSAIYSISLSGADATEKTFQTILLRYRVFGALTGQVRNLGAIIVAEQHWVIGIWGLISVGLLVVLHTKKERILLGVYDGLLVLLRNVLIVLETACILPVLLFEDRVERCKFVVSSLLETIFQFVFQTSKRVLLVLDKVPLLHHLDDQRVSRFNDFVFISRVPDVFPLLCSWFFNLNNFWFPKEVNTPSS